jgi:hypothetical protein
MPELLRYICPEIDYKKNDFIEKSSEQEINSRNSGVVQF